MQLTDTPLKSRQRRTLTQTDSSGWETTLARRRHYLGRQSSVLVAPSVDTDLDQRVAHEPVGKAPEPATAAGMQRIVIVGSGGAGKSTLARQLGKLLHIQVSHLDTLFWKPGWVEPSYVEWRHLVEQMVQGDTWIIEGNYGSTYETRFAAADTIIFLDFPRIICLWRAVKRRLQYRARPRPDRAPGCREKLDFAFLKWIWAYAAIRRPSVIERIQKHSAGKRVIVLRNPGEVRRWLKRLQQ